MSNKVLFGSEARAKLKEGIDLVHGAVSVTLGANGRNAVYNKWSRVPIITNDGVSIAREVAPEDLGALQGANLLKQVSERTNDEAGDDFVHSLQPIELGSSCHRTTSHTVSSLKKRWRD